MVITAIRRPSSFLITITKPNAHEQRRSSNPVRTPLPPTCRTVDGQTGTPPPASALDPIPAVRRIIACISGDPSARRSISTKKSGILALMDIITYPFHSPHHFYSQAGFVRLTLKGNKMAAVAEKAIGSDDPFTHRQSPAEAEAEAEREYRRDVKDLVDLLSKLNPSAKEFFPSSYAASGDAADGHRKFDGRLSADAPIFVSWNDFYYNSELIDNNGGTKSSIDGSSNDQPNRRVVTRILFLLNLISLLSFIANWDLSLDGLNCRVQSILIVQLCPYVSEKIQPH
ncbi:hypothetical protein BHM03_00026279 [Ensete ventricosum]|nr:hypothetical protein BHM03_00026279 [Ensete ventricosum]